eukprot:4996166-Lingulodinium_polyedra.AAC.1
MSGSLGATADGVAAASPTPGCGEADSLRAEAAALPWAMAWVAQAAGRPEVAAAGFHFRFDATA